MTDTIMVEDAAERLDYIQVVADVGTTMIRGALPFEQDGFTWYTAVPARVLDSVLGNQLAAVRDHTVLARGTVRTFIRGDETCTIEVRPPTGGNQYHV